MDILYPIKTSDQNEALTVKRERWPLSEKSRLCLNKKITKPNALLQNKKTQQIRCLKIKAATKLHLNVKISILQHIHEFKKGSV